jgi:hypothetical protein
MRNEYSRVGRRGLKIITCHRSPTRRRARWHR